MNNAVFIVRVARWAFKMFATALSVREYQPDLEFKYTEQSGMGEMIKRVSFLPKSTRLGFFTKLILDSLGRTQPSLMCSSVSSTVSRHLRARN